MQNESFIQTEYYLSTCIHSIRNTVIGTTTSLYISVTRKYGDLQAKILTEKAVGMDKDNISEAMSQVRLEDEAYHELIIEYLTHEDDDYSLSSSPVASKHSNL